MNTKRKAWFLSIVALVSAFAFVTEASAKSAGSVLHITWSPKVADAGPFECTTVPDQCTGAFSADVHSNISHEVGVGTDTFIIKPVNGAYDPCNEFIETTRFEFPEGSVTTHSDHIDCPAWIRPFPAGDSPGPRIDTTFTIIAGTGAFAGATGGGDEHGFGGGRQGAIIYQGTMFHP